MEFTGPIKTRVQGRTVVTETNLGFLFEIAAVFVLIFALDVWWLWSILVVLLASFEVKFATTRRFR